MFFAGVWDWLSGASDHRFGYDYGSIGLKMEAIQNEPCLPRTNLIPITWTSVNEDMQPLVVDYMVSSALILTFYVGSRAVQRRTSMRHGID